MHPGCTLQTRESESLWIRVHDADARNAHGKFREMVSLELQLVWFLAGDGAGEGMVALLSMAAFVG